MEVTSANCNEFGLQHISSPHLQDRCLVIYRAETKEFITARTFPTLMLVETSATDDQHFDLTAPNMEPIKVQIPSSNASYKSTIFMWNGEPVSVVDCGDEAASWISSYTLGKVFGLRLGYHDVNVKRTIGSNKEFLKIYPKLKNSTMGIFSDLGSLLLLTKSSVNDLISRIPDSNVREENFRPNLVIEGDDLKPYEEDNWDWIRIGDVILQNVANCIRCSMTTMDPETGKLLKKNEPLKTLRSYRPISPYDTKIRYPNFGIYMSVCNDGQLNVNDVVYCGYN